MHGVTLVLLLPDAHRRRSLSGTGLFPTYERTRVPKVSSRAHWHHSTAEGEGLDHGYPCRLNQGSSATSSGLWPHVSRVAIRLFNVSRSYGHISLVPLL
jgi:hypothetical protein